MKHGLISAMGKPACLVLVALTIAKSDPENWCNKMQLNFTNLSVNSYLNTHQVHEKTLVSLPHSHLIQIAGSWLILSRPLQQPSDIDFHPWIYQLLILRSADSLTPKLTCPLKIDGWKMKFPFGMDYFQGLC